MVVDFGESYVSSYITARENATDDDITNNGRKYQGSFKSFSFISKYLNETNQMLVKYASIASTIKDEATNRLNEQIKIAQQKEDLLCRILNARNIKEIEARIRLINSMTDIRNLSGPAMERVWKMDFLKVSDAQYFADLQRKWDTYWAEQIKNEGSVQNILQGQSFTDWVFNSLRVEHGKFRSTSGIQGENILVTELSKTQRIRLEEFLNKVEKDKRKTAKQIKKSSTKTTSGVITNGPTVQTWMTMTSQAADDLANDKLSDDDLTEVNRELTDYLLSKVGNNIDVPLFKACVNHVLTSKRTEFISDRTGNLFRGILGEIQALYYFAMLSNSPPGRVAKWVGGTTKEGSKPHVDILLKDVTSGEPVGVQIKNTGEDVVEKDEKTITFRKLNFENFFSIYSEQLMATYKTDLDSLKQAALNMIEIYKFHVPYTWDQNGYYYGDNPDFSEMRDAIVSLWSKLSALLEILSMSLMYLDIEETSISAFKKNPKTAMFLIGGISCIGIVEVLNQIKEELFNFSNANDHLFYIKPEVDNRKTYTIVDYLNFTLNPQENKDDQQANTGGVTQIESSIQSMLSAVKLTSSFTFTKLSHLS